VHPENASPASPVEQLGFESVQPVHWACGLGKRLAIALAYLLQ
jgi:hypothetical protein